VCVCVCVCAYLRRRGVTAGEERQQNGTLTAPRRFRSEQLAEVQSGNDISPDIRLLLATLARSAADSAGLQGGSKK